MVQLVKKNLTRERGGDELYLGKAFFSSLSWAPGGGGFRRWRGDEQWGCVAVGSGGSPAWLDGGGGAPARRCASAGQAAPWRADLLRQRVFGIALGYEDLNDHAALRHDLALQTASGRDRALASAATLCRFENRAERGWAWAVHAALVESFIAGFERAPAELVLDIGLHRTSIPSGRARDAGSWPVHRWS